MKERIEFDSHKVLKRPIEVEFIARDGTAVNFSSRKKMKVPVHRANVK
jgi:hypothetical protein